MRHRLVLIILVAFLMVSCTNFAPNVTKTSAQLDIELSCQDFLSTLFREYLGHTLSLEQALQMIQSSFSLVTEQITVAELMGGAEGNVGVEWSSQGTRTMLFWQEESLSKIYIGLEETSTTAGQVIDCLGQQPDAYRAIYGPRMEQSGVNYSFEMWFASEGIVARVNSSAESAKSIPPISQLTPITDLFLVSPGSLEEMRQRIGAPFMPFTPLIYEEKTADALLPQIWPSDWSQIQYRQAW